MTLEKAWPGEPGGQPLLRRYANGLKSGLWRAGSRPEGTNIVRLARLTSIRGILLIFTAIVCVAGGLYGIYLGQDVNFDQLNYHYYSAYAFVHGRLSVDAAPAGLAHTYFNALPYVPFYLLERNLPLWAVVFVLGALHGCNLGLVLLIAWSTTAGVATRLRLMLCAGALLISLASPMALSEVGSSFSDIATSTFVLAGLALIIESVSPGRARYGLLLTGLGSGAIGIAIGLKLTNALYAPGVVACCMIGWRGWIGRVQALSSAGAGGTCGFLFSGGFWLHRMWVAFRSPFFPYYDAIFRSPAIDTHSWLHGTSFFDDRYLPKSRIEAVALPFRWLTIRTSTVEIGFATFDLL